MNKLVVYDSSIISFDANGQIIVVKRVVDISVNIPFRTDDSGLNSFSGDRSIVLFKKSKNLGDECDFIFPSNISKTIKRSTIELKLTKKVNRGGIIGGQSLNISPINFFISRLHEYMDTILIMTGSYYSNLFKLFFVYFGIIFIHVKSFGFEFKYLEINIKYSNKSIKIVYSNLFTCFYYLFANNLNDLFPNSIINKSFNNKEDFELFGYTNSLSFKEIKSVVRRVLGINGNLFTRGLFGIDILKLEYKARVEDREGVKIDICKFYSFGGNSINKCSTRPIFDEINFFSCNSESYNYSDPYTKILSFNTAGRMYQFCKTFKFQGAKSVIPASMRIEDSKKRVLDIDTTSFNNRYSPHSTQTLKNRYDPKRWWQIHWASLSKSNKKNK